MNPDYLKVLVGSDGCLTTALAEGEAVVLQVDGECMEPAVGHKASVRLTRSRFLIPGDVVAFYSPNIRRILCHRFLGYVRHNGAWRLVTMPDKGARHDPLVDVSAVLGKVTAQDRRVFRISLFDRLMALFRFTLCCLHHIIRRLTPLRLS
jgi:hypothetical protein